LLCCTDHWSRRIEPFLYKTLIFRGRDKHRLIAAIQALQQRSPDFIREHVRRIFVLLPNEELDRDLLALLAMCSGVQDLVLWNLTPKMLPFLPLPLRRLSLPLRLILPSRTDIISGPFLSNLTHLDVHAIRGLAAWIGDLPSLTHLAIYNPRDTSRPLLHNLIQASKRLRVLVLVFTLRRFSSQFIGPHSQIIDDPRVVLMRTKNDLLYHYSDWKSGVAGGRDFWAYAEEFLDMKQSDPSIGLSCLIFGD
jgi:hypothetical protein